MLQEIIETKLHKAFAPEYLKVVNESYMHNVPAGSESHFKVTVVSDAFEGKRLLARHREVNALAAEALAGPVHALALHTYTSKEWEARGGESLTSPNCLGGSKHDA